MQDQEQTFKNNKNMPAGNIGLAKAGQTEVIEHL